MAINVPRDHLDWRIKGLPAAWRGDAATLTGAGLSVLGEDLMLPAAVLRRSTLEHNSRWMKRFTELTGTQIAPHGKTTMSPELFRRQLEDGTGNGADGDGGNGAEAGSAKVASGFSRTVHRHGAAV